MPWADDFLDELTNTTGLDGDLLVEVIYSLPQNAQQRAERERAVAGQRAQALLLAHLNDEQRAEFLADPVSCTQNRGSGYTPAGSPSFRTTGSEGGRYCVHLGRAHNIWRLNENNQHTVNYCYHVAQPVPNEDNVLAQVLFIEGDEAGFLRVANHS